MKLLKGLLVASILFVLGATKAHAEIETAEVINSSMTTFVIAVGSTTATNPTQVDSSSVVLENRKSLEIQNLDSTAKVYCRHNNSFSSTTKGKLISPNGGTWTVNLRARDNDGTRLSIYCISDSTTGTVDVALTQVRSK